MATFLPMYLFTKAVAGEAAEVKVLIPPGTEVHEYQSKPGDVQAIAQADVLVENGLGLESFLRDTIKSAQNSKLVIVDASRGITPVGAVAPSHHAADKHGQDEHGHAEEGDDHKADAAGHSHPEGNPHVWLDPVLVKQQIANIRDELIKVDPSNQSTYQANAATYIQQLETLDRQFQQTLQKYPNCTFVTFHNAYPYLARRYQLQQVAVVELPEDNLSPAEVQNAIATVKQYKVKALFGEPGTDNKLLQSLAQDLNLPLRPLDSLEAGSLDPQYYFTAMQKNLQTLEAACQ
jgi:zinc/manganese transport system substrate-binding protein